MDHPHQGPAGTRQKHAHLVGTMGRPRRCACLRPYSVIGPARQPRVDFEPNHRRPLHELHVPAPLDGPHHLGSVDPAHHRLGHRRGSPVPAATGRVERVYRAALCALGRRGAGVARAAVGRHAAVDDPADGVRVFPQGALRFGHGVHWRRDRALEGVAVLFGARVGAVVCGSRREAGEDGPAALWVYPRSGQGRVRGRAGGDEVLEGREAWGCGEAGL